MVWIKFGIAFSCHTITARNFGRLGRLQAAEIEALEESSRNTKVKLLDIGANLAQFLSCLWNLEMTDIYGLRDVEKK